MLRSAWGKGSEGFVAAHFDDAQQIRTSRSSHRNSTPSTLFAKDIKKWVDVLR
jgi:hypothetical protein